MAMQWHVEQRKVSELVAYEHNPRVLTKKGLADLKKSVEKFGLAEPIVINTDNTIIGGHARTRVLSPDQVIEVYVPERQLDEQEYKELNVRLNKNIAGEWDFDILANNFELPDLLKWGFDEKELKFDLPVEVSDDEVPDIDEVNAPIAQLGDIYKLGEHRLMCGDSTKHEDVEKLMEGNKADMVFTDPPYFVGLTSTGLTISQADKSNILHFFTAWMSNLSKFSKGHWYICTDWRTYPVIQDAAISNLGRMTNLIVWDFEWIKAGGQYRFTHELIMFGDRDNKKQVPRSEPDVWRLQAINFTAERLHGAEKPVGLMARAIKNSSTEGDVVLDLFGGSGSTLIACEQLGRKCYMMELDPKYCDVIVKRWEQFTGLKAEKV